MESLKCLIVDDEPLARKGISLHLSELPELQEIGSVGNAIKAGEFIKTHHVDIIYLDIEMPGISGMQFLETLSPDILVILTTAYPQFAVDAFSLDVVDYLLKPIKFDRFYKASQKAIDIHRLRHQVSETDTTELHDDYMFIRSDRKIVKIYFDEISYIKGLKDYVIVHTASEKYITAMNVKTIFEQLPKILFARVSKSHIVYVPKVSSLSHESVFLDTEEIPLGKTYRKTFIENYVGDRLVRR